MSALTLTLIRVAFLAVLWLFVIAAIGVVRTDLLGGSPPAAAQTGPARPRAPGHRASPARPSRSGPAAARRASWW